MRQDRSSRLALGGLARFDECLLKPPPDLADTYVAMGKEALEAHYGVRKTVLLRWLSELDEGVLKRRRSAQVTKLRKRLRPLSSRTRRLTIVEDSRPANPRVAAAAAHFLRVSRNGGWIVSRTQFGDWRVGQRRLSGHQLIEMAVAKGFDAREVHE